MCVESSDRENAGRDISMQDISGALSEAALATGSSTAMIKKTREHFEAEKALEGKFGAE